MPPAQPVRLPSLSAQNTIFYVVLSCCVFLAGCGAPGEPLPRSPAVPQPVADLTARQAGDGVLLSFSVPGKTVSGQRLTENPGGEILRGTVGADGAPMTNSFHLVYTIPGALLTNYVNEKHVEFLDPLSPAEAKAHPGGKVAYVVRTRISEKKASANSNTVIVAIFPVPQTISSVDVRVTESAVELSWAAPTQTSGGEPLGDFSYHVYRGRLEALTDQAAIDAAAKELGHAKWKSKLALLASPATASYRDSDFEFGETYVYVVRTAVKTADGNLESADSEPAVVTPRDTFPPSAPQGLAAAVLDENGTGVPVVDLSWSISPENDVAGYRVYRSEQEGVRGDSLQANLLPSPAVRDTSIRPGNHYWYTVTAVDRAGNESAGSVGIMVEVAAR